METLTNPISETNGELNVTKKLETLTFYESLIICAVSWVFLAGSCSMFGILANVINLVIFYKHGLNTTMNISFFALAISDLLSLASLLISCIFMNPLIINSNIHLHTSDIQYLVSSWPHACFGHITCWITAYITAERCLCIAFPLKIKQIVTPRRTTVTICIMYLLNIGAAVPEYCSVYIDWKLFSVKNRSMLGLVYRDNREEIKLIGFYLFAVLGAISFPSVIIFTVILIVKLKEQTAWRMTSTSGGKQTEANTKRDLKTMNMVVLIAIVLIISYIPGVMTSLVTIFAPEFDIAGSEVNLFKAVWGFVFLFEAINSSVNIFLYYKMSTKFKNSFRELFWVFRKQNLHDVTRNYELPEDDFQD